MIRKIATIVAGTALSAVLYSASAQAVTVTAYDGNDCAGVFGQGFSDCKVNGSPIIAKVDASGATEINSSLFSTIDGSEFSFTQTGQGTGTWTYTMGAGDPFLTALVAKGGSVFNLFTDLAAAVGNVYSGSWYTPINPKNGKHYGLSHLSFYDTGENPGGGGGGPGSEVPLPGALPLLLTGLAAMGWLGARRKAI